MDEPKIGEHGGAGAARKVAEAEYVLGTEVAETERLRFQHGVWSAAALGLWQRAGLGAGQRVLDLGCGPGYTTLALADVVGPEGTLVARDQSERFLAYLRTECDRRRVRNVETSLGPVEELDLGPQEFDAAYSRWLFCWLPDPAAVLARVVGGVRPGGALVLQEYLDWAAMSLLPVSPVFERAVAACMRSWEMSAGTIDIGRELPSLALGLGLRVESLAPITRVGPVGSLEWRWLEQFFWSYLPKLVATGLLSGEDWAEFQGEWRARAAQGTSWIQTPTMVDLVLRVP